MFECFFGFAVLVFLLALLGAVGARGQSRHGRRNQVYSSVARRFHGTCISGGWFGNPTIRIPYATSQASLTCRAVPRTGRGEYTQFEIAWPDPHFHCEIATRRTDIGENPFREMTELKVGVERFDDIYSVRSNEVREARNFLSDGVQWQLDKLRYFLGQHDIFVFVNHGCLVVRKHARVGTQETLEEYIQLCLELYDQAMLTRCVGISFIDSDMGQLIKDARCQVCGEGIVLDMVFCRRCKTPHHAECWQYNGSCTTFGCQETRYVVPQIANTSEDCEPRGKPRPR